MRRGGVGIRDTAAPPDTGVAVPAADLEAKKDPQMARAIRFLTTGK